MDEPEPVGDSGVSDLAFQEFGDADDELVADAPTVALTLDGEADSPDADDSAPPTTYRPWRLEFYQPYFNIDTRGFASKLLSTLLPIRRSFFDTPADLYGGIWIPTTLFVLLCITSHISGWWARRGKLADLFRENPAFDPTNLEAWASDFTLFSVGSLVFLFYFATVPLIIWILNRWRGVGIGLVQSLSLFGYSFCPAIIPCLGLWFYSEWLQPILVLASFVLASIVVIWNGWTALWAKVVQEEDGDAEGSGGRRGWIVGVVSSIIVLLGNGVLATFVALFFYRFRFEAKL